MIAPSCSWSTFEPACAWYCSNGNASRGLTSVGIEYARLGVGFHGSRPNDNGRTAVSHAVVHPSFNSVDRSYDVALVRLSSPLHFDDHVRPVCLPSSSNEVFGSLTRCVVTGLAYTPLSGRSWSFACTSV